MRKTLSFSKCERMHELALCVFIHQFHQQPILYYPNAAKQANDFMEALHEIPQMLTHGSRHDVDDLRTHLGCYHHTRWKDAPDLVKMFANKLAELSE